MAGGSIQDEFLSRRPGADCWRILTDVERLAGWVDMVGEVEVLVPLKEYAAVLREEMGPFKLTANLEVSVTSVDEGRNIAFLAEGDDQLGISHLVVEAGMTLTPADSGTWVSFTGEYAVSGRIATMGSGLIERKADAAFGQFFARAKEELA